MPSHSKPIASKQEKQKHSIMGTNNSSIVSKRSVERVYLDPPHFFHHFVKKPQRRSPLINRGYWLRMRAVDVIIQRFLECESECQKVVINLGCGYDPLAFQWLSKSASLSPDVIFIDVDYPALIEKKSEMIMNTPDLVAIIDPIQNHDGVQGISLSSPRYYTVGCDLTDTKRLDSLLANVLDPSACLILCTAEVSMTYMPADAADSLIRWAAQLANSQTSLAGQRPSTNTRNEVHFCLLEQFLPDGEQHPFASKMVAHFEKLQTPLKNIRKYPRLNDVELRFSQSGWPSAIARSLWDVYCDANFVTQSDRQDLNERETFDEWEELVLFASHYFLLTACNVEKANLQRPHRHHQPVELVSHGSELSFHAAPYLNGRKSYGRRFGAIVTQEDAFHHHGGLDSQTRSATMDEHFLRRTGKPSNVHTKDSNQLAPQAQIQEPEARMCHTITQFTGGYLLVGGRKSPGHVLGDCWLFNEKGWQRSDDLPFPVFRHSATTIRFDSNGSEQDGVLVYGGKCSNKVVSNKWLLWQKPIGWKELAVTGCISSGRFGAAFAFTSNGAGILVGGMDEDGFIQRDHLAWNIGNDQQGSKIQCKEIQIVGQDSYPAKYIDRFGAAMTASKNHLLLIGGISHEIIPRNFEILGLLREELLDGTPVYKAKAVLMDPNVERPLLIGHSAFCNADDILIAGGGAVCFSFGTFWNLDILVSVPNHTKPSISIESRHQDPAVRQKSIPRMGSSPPTIRHEHVIEKRTIGHASDFAAIIKAERPVILQGLDVGPCLIKWQDLKYVKNQVGVDRDVVVHQGNSAQLDFQKKNFTYVKKPFGVFIDEITASSMQYLRSLASENAARKPANFEADFPQLASEFILPDSLQFARQQMHSSVLRISGPISIWLHYDVMANLLCQVRSEKTLLLFPPSDVTHLSFPAGSTTSAVNCFDSDFSRDPSLAKTHPHTAVLNPGDVIFIPPLWLHTVSPGKDVGIAVNVFFRNLDHGYASGRDVYGNRDVQAYEQGRRDVDRICQSFGRLPPDMRGFYLERLADELKERAWHVTPHS